METTHSKTRRTKGSAPKIVVPSWDKVWESIGKESALTTIEAMNAEGWKTVDQVMKITGLSDSRIRNMIGEERFDRVKKKVKDSGTIKTINFVRPKTTISQ
jgi:hypothetical protein